MAIKKYLRIRNEIVREMLAECIGTFILVTFAIGSGAQYVLSRGALSSFLTVNFAGGMGLTFAIYWAGGVSGAHVNPAVTFGLCLQGIVAWRKYVFYVIAQFAGAFIAAAVQYGIFYDAINAYDGGVRSTYGPTATAGIFSTFPNSQVFATFILISCILAIIDGRNMKPDNGLAPIALGSIVFAIGTCWGFNCGYPLNPARDLAPRAFTALAGWGSEPFSYRNYNWFWVPIAGPMTGAVVAWLMYNLFIQLHWPESDEVELTRAVTLISDLTPSNGEVKVAGVDNPAFSRDQLTTDLDSQQRSQL